MRRSFAYRLPFTSAEWRRPCCVFAGKIADQSGRVLSRSSARSSCDGLTLLCSRASKARYFWSGRFLQGVAGCWRGGVRHSARHARRASPGESAVIIEWDYLYCAGTAPVVGHLIGALRFPAVCRFYVRDAGHCACYHRLSCARRARQG